MVVALPIFAVTKSLLGALPNGLVPNMLRKTGLLGAFPVMASSSMTQPDACVFGSQGVDVGSWVEKTILPFSKFGKLTERSLGMLEGVDKSIYHPDCWLCVVSVVWPAQEVW